MYARAQSKCVCVISAYVLTCFFELAKKNVYPPLSRNNFTKIKPTSSIWSAHYPYLISIVCCDKYIWRDVLHRTIHIKIVNFRKFFINHTTDSNFIYYFCTDKLILTKIFSNMIKPVIKNCGILYQEIILTSLQSYMVEMRCNGNMSRADVVQDIINNLQFE